VAAEAEADMAEAAVAAAAIVEIVATAGIAATAGNAPGNTFLQRAAAARGRFLDCVFRAIAIGLPVPGPSRLVCHGPVNGSQLSPQ